MRKIKASLKWIILLLLMNLIVVACNTTELVAVTPLAEETSQTESTTTFAVAEVTIERVTPEPTATLAVCTTQPEDLHITIRRETDLHGVIEVVGLQPGERPTLLLTGEATNASWRKDTQYENVVEAVGRFVDPCSGDEWELNGALNLEHSTELWSNRDLDQYGLSIQEGKIFVQMHQIVEGLPVTEPPLAQDSQYGVTVTAVTAEFTPETTTIETMIQVDPIWQMAPAAFPPQQALSYPDLLVDDQGHTIFHKGREGGTAVYDPRSGGTQQMMFNHWEAVGPDATVVTATLTVDLSNLYREVTLPLEWDAHKPGDTWDVDLPLGIGHADVRVRQIEWLATAANGLARLRFTVNDESLNDLRLICLEADTAAPSTPACAAFDNEQTYTILTQPGEPITLYLRAEVELQRPFQLRMDTVQHE